MTFRCANKRCSCEEARSKQAFTKKQLGKCVILAAHFGIVIGNRVPSDRIKALHEVPEGSNFTSTQELYLKMELKSFFTLPEKSRQPILCSACSIEMYALLTRETLNWNRALPRGVQTVDILNFSVVMLADLVESDVKEVSNRRIKYDEECLTLRKRKQRINSLSDYAATYQDEKDSTREGSPIVQSPSESRSSLPLPTNLFQIESIEEVLGRIVTRVSDGIPINELTLAMSQYGFAHLAKVVSYDGCNSSEVNVAMFAGGNKKVKLGLVFASKVVDDCWVKSIEIVNKESEVTAKRIEKEAERAAKKGSKRGQNEVASSSSNKYSRNYNTSRRKPMRR
jgi:hypothetical protein